MHLLKHDHPDRRWWDMMIGDKRLAQIDIVDLLTLYNEAKREVAAIGDPLFELAALLEENRKEAAL
jgi:hypothetical protein